MKHTKRIFAMFLSLAMVMTMMIAMSATAFAVENYPITIKNPNATTEHQYNAYQVFAGTLSEKDGKKVLSNIVWGNGVDGPAILTALKASNAFGATNPFADCENASDVAKAMKDFDDNAALIEAFADIVGEHLVTANAIASSPVDGKENKEYVVNAPAAGYYIVKEGTNPETARSASGYMIQVVGPSEMNVKDQPMTPDKNILQNGTTKVKEGTANVGDTVNFVVDTIKVPSTDGYKTFKFVMKDTLPKGLTFGEVTSVKLDKTGNALDASAYTVTTKTNADGSTELRIAIKDALTALKPYEGKEVEIKYTATVNKDANFGNTGNKNEVVFEFTNNPGDESTGDDFGPNEPHGITPESETTTYVTEIIVKKVDEAGAAVGGAVFTLSGSAKNVVVTTGQHFVKDSAGTYYLLNDGTYTTEVPTDDTKDKYASTTDKYKLESYEATELSGAENVDIVGVVSDATTGEATFAGLKDGTYTLTETGAPVGYNKITDPIELKIKFANKQFSVDGDTPAGVSVENGVFTITVVNKAGSTLPSTGGIGTVIFYVLGSALLIGCGVVLISKRRMSKEK